jgi:hypothetical protein
MSTEPTPPFWFRLRQGKLESAGTDSYRVTAPNLGEAWIGIRPSANGHWQPVLRLTKDGPDRADPPVELATPQDAWDAAFELYRVQVVV